MCAQQYLVVVYKLLLFCAGLILGLGFTSQRDATNAGVGTVNALFMLGGEYDYSKTGQLLLNNRLLRFGL